MSTLKLDEDDVPEEEEKPVRQRTVEFADPEEANDTLSTLPTSGPSARTSSHHRRPSLSENVANLVNPKILTKDSDELDEIPDMFINARRGSLLY
jgi:hypothetical protein